MAEEHVSGNLMCPAAARQSNKLIENLGQASLPITLAFEAVGYISRASPGLKAGAVDEL
jgi:hypothetical protein